MLPTTLVSLLSYDPTLTSGSKVQLLTRDFLYGAIITQELQHPRDISKVVHIFLNFCIDKRANNYCDATELGGLGVCICAPNDLRPDRQSLQHQVRFHSTRDQSRAALLNLLRLRCPMRIQNSRKLPASSLSWSRVSCCLSARILKTQVSAPEMNEPREAACFRRGFYH